MDEFVCITALSRTDETEEAFSARLTRFWTHMLRSFKDDFEKVYAETTEFETARGRLSRQYLAEDEVVDLVIREMKTAGIDHEPIDRDDTYSRYEAVAPEWMQIEH
ncbi:MAG: hypothetical protein U1D30_14230 [Planctomycetota bacterium]